jgi:hypothetical protein
VAAGKMHKMMKHREVAKKRRDELIAKIMGIAEKGEEEKSDELPALTVCLVSFGQAFVFCLVVTILLIIVLYVSQISAPVEQIQGPMSVLAQVIYNSTAGSSVQNNVGAESAACATFRGGYATCIGAWGAPSIQLLT